MEEYVGIYIKTEKAQEQDGFGNKMKYMYHFHITTLHKYRQLSKGKTQRSDTVSLLCVLPLLSYHTYTCMYGCYVEVVFHFVAKAILFLCFFGFDIYPYLLPKQSCSCAFSF